MTDASTASATPAAASPTNLLSLPTEILTQIASDVAPHGGAKAGHLRLVCKTLNAVARRTVLSSLRCNVNSESIAGLLRTILLDGSALNAIVTSFRVDLDPNNSMSSRIAPLAAAAIQKLVRLERLDMLSISAKTDDVHLCIKCFNLEMISRLELSKIVTLEIWINSPLETLHISGLALMWDSTNPQGRHVLPFLKAISSTKLHTLTLPIVIMDIIEDIFRGLVMPTVTTLCLENEWDRVPIPLNLDSFDLLSSLLLASFPNLEVLQLHGWDQDGPRAIGQIAPAWLVLHYPMVYLLLALLATYTKVVAVSIRGNEYIDRNYEVQFWRGGGSMEWSSEVFLLF
ncbi:hypothetical protein RQP46_007979 [Phenoliferia psychrophenolica]